MLNSFFREVYSFSHARCMTLRMLMSVCGLEFFRTLEPRPDPGPAFGQVQIIVIVIGLGQVPCFHLGSLVCVLCLKDSYARMPFIDLNSAFNTIIPQRLVRKLSLLGTNTSLYNWILDFLTDWPQSISKGSNTCGVIKLSTGTSKAACSAHCCSIC